MAATDLSVFGREKGISDERESDKEGFWLSHRRKWKKLHGYYFLSSESRPHGKVLNSMPIKSTSAAGPPHGHLIARYTCGGLDSIGPSLSLEQDVASECMLVAANNIPVRKLLSWILMSAGYRVVQARDGRGAVRVASLPKIDLLLTNAILP